MRLILVRHPAPQVSSGICYGRSDVAVAPEEREKVLASLRHSLPPNIPIYTSPLLRCADLAQQLAEDLPASTLHIDARLAELDFGNWEMLSWETIPRAEIDAWAADMAHYRPGGGENVLDMTARILAFLHDLLREQHAEAILICHAGTIRLLCALQRGLSLEETAALAASSAHKIGYGAAMTVIFDD
ncbi:histidine phosphatase family protein [Janthinobacterium sp.]|uniref:histidine phosphatase family protein n=1 Tax=Janthinobacterium sp. TaxID=1871054 RepID=UPI00262AFF8E|nr:histidine phosphatase family protein [Janthinobacterium sp.]